MKIRKIDRNLILVLMSATVFVSCVKKSAPKDDGAIQVATRSTGSTNSNEKLTLTPYPTGKRAVTSSDSKKPEEKPEEIDEKKEAAEEKKEPPVYPISEFLFTEKDSSAASPAGPSIPDSPTISVPPSVGKRTQTLSNPPDIQTRPETVDPPVEETPVEESAVVEETPVEPETKVEEPVEEPAVDTTLQEEYERSINSASNITREAFTEDKKSILAIIDILSEIMKNKDYKKWRTYVDDASIKYWSTRTNLQKAQNRLPVKGITLKTLEDYFKYVFIPSRTGRTVDEIRYETDTQVKVVHVDGDEDTVYYYFKKSANGEWKLHLPPI